MQNETVNSAARSMLLGIAGYRYPLAVQKSCKKNIASFLWELIFNAQNLQWPIYIWIYFRETDTSEPFPFHSRRSNPVPWHTPIWRGQGQSGVEQLILLRAPFLGPLASPEQTTPKANPLTWKSAKTHGHGLLSKPLPIRGPSLQAVNHSGLWNTMNLKIIQKIKSPLTACLFPVWQQGSTATYSCNLLTTVCMSQFHPTG